MNGEGLSYERNEIMEASYYANMEAMDYLLQINEDEDEEILSARLPVIMDRKEAHYGRTAVMVCGLKAEIEDRKTVDSACVKIAKLLKERGARLNIEDKEGWNAVAIASSKGYPKLVRYFISQGVPFTSGDDRGLTPLMKAAMHGFFDVFETLVHAGAPLDAQSSEGLTALHYAANLALLEERYFTHFTSMMASASLSDLDNTFDKDGRSVLMYATINGNLPMVEWLLLHGVDFENIKDGYGVAVTEMTSDDRIQQLFESTAEIRRVELAHKQWLDETSKVVKNTEDLNDGVEL